MDDVESNDNNTNNSDKNKSTYTPPPNIKAPINMHPNNCQLYTRMISPTKKIQAYSSTHSTMKTQSQKHHMTSPSQIMIKVSTRMHQCLNKLLLAQMTPMVYDLQETSVQENQ
jgi:hypothetical protein